MKISRRSRSGPAAIYESLGGEPDIPEGEVPVDCCTPGDTPDRALETEARVLTEPTTDDPIVQFAMAVSPNPSHAVLATPATEGNTLIAIAWRRDSGEPDDPAHGGFTTIAKAEDSISFQRSVAIWYHVVEADESPYTRSGDGVTYEAGQPGDWFMVVETAGSYASISAERNDVASTTVLNAGGSVTPGAGDDVLIVGAAVPHNNHASGISEDTGVTSLHDAFDGGFSPYKWAGYRVVEDASGSYTVGGTMTSDHFAGVTAVFEITGPTPQTWDVPAPDTVDGDDLTYHEVDGPDVLRVDLGGPFRIVRARLLMGSENAGTVTYRIRGANEADFSDAVELVSETFDVTGSFTADDIDFSWITTESYRYFELSGTDETRRIFSFELYEPNPALGEDHQHDNLQEQIDDLIEAVAGGFVTKTDGGLETLEAHGAVGTTETIDLADGNWHSLTLDDDCAVTVEGFTAAAGCSALVKITQDGTGGWAITWDADIVWAGDDQPGQGAGDVSWFMLVSDEGDGTIYGFPIGGGGSPATTVEDETTFGIAPAVGTDTEYARQDHTHGTPDDPVSEEIIRDIGHWEVVVSGSAPPVAVSTPGDDDWVYGWVAG